MSYKVSLLTSKKARPFPNITPAWEQKEIAPQKVVWLPVLKFVVTIKSGHRNFIKIHICISPVACLLFPCTSLKHRKS